MESGSIQKLLLRQKRCICPKKKIVVAESLTTDGIPYIDACFILSAGMEMAAGTIGVMGHFL